MTVCTSVTTARDVIVAPEMAVMSPPSLASFIPSPCPFSLSRQAPSVVSAALAGAAGTLFATNYSTIVANKFDFNTSILVLVFVVLGGLVNSKTRRMTQAKKDALNKLCAETELPPEVRGMVIDAVNWQVRRMATTSLKENSKYKSNMKKDLRTFIEGYFGRFDY